MVVLRGLGWLFLLATAAVGVYEVVAYVEKGSLTLSAVGELWFKLHAPSLNLSQAIVQRYLNEELWDVIVRTILLQPALLLFGGVALFCLAVGYIFRRRVESPAAARRRRRRR